MSPPISGRRRLLRLGAGLGLAAGAGPALSLVGCGGSSPTEPGESPRPGNPLPRPPDLSGDLVAEPGTATVWPGTTTPVWTLGGACPSPTLRLSAGQNAGVRLRNELELWEVVNASAHPHPFHVHAVQFQVASRTSGPIGPHETGWKDTVLVWPGERMELLMRFEGDAGLFILHCHNLEHEDAGMMLNMEVL